MPQTLNVAGQYEIKINGTQIFLLTSGGLNLTGLDGTPIGGTTPAAITGTTITATGNVLITGSKLQVNGEASFEPTVGINVLGAAGEPVVGVDAGTLLRLANDGNVSLALHGSATATASVYFGKPGASGNTKGQINYLTATDAMTLAAGGLVQFALATTASAVDYLQAAGGATGSPGTVTLSAQGTDSDIDIAVTPKGTGIVKSAASLAVLSATAIPAGGTAGAGYKFSSTANFGVFFGSGAPTLAAAKGSLYLRSDGSGTTDRAYINTDGSTTWTALTTAA